MNKYRVVQIGLGPRGRYHLDGFFKNSDFFEVVAICDISEERLKECSRQYGIEAAYNDADQMMKEIKPEVLSFATLPNLRLSLVELGVKYGVKALVFEKPMATSLDEARIITEICNENGIKAIVSHQHKYLPSMQKLKSIVDSGDIGDVIMVQATTQPWMSQLGTHYMDYALWVNNGFKAKWVVGHVHGKEKLSDSHPSADYVLGEVLAVNGVRIFIECGYLTQPHSKAGRFWEDDRLTVYGTHGYAWAESDGAWAAFTKKSGGKVMEGQEKPWTEQEPILQAPYLRDLAYWLEDDLKVHPCNVNISYHGYEILEGLYLSALNHTRIDLPIVGSKYEDVIERMKRELPDVEAPVK